MRTLRRGSMLLCNLLGLRMCKARNYILFKVNLGEELEMEDYNSSIRNHKLDNIKGILTILVVLGHLLELDMGYGINKLIYVIIYTFHMPVFVFISGYFANFSISKIGRKLLYPYLLFQMLYLLFDKHLINTETTIQFLTPYWLLWYLWAMIVWTLAIPIIKGETTRKRGIILGITILAAIFIGNKNVIGRMLSLSRIFVYFPFFACGYYARGWNNTTVYRIRFKKAFKAYKELMIVVIAVCLTLVVIYCIGHYNEIDRNWLYEAVSYRDGAYTMGFRILHLSIAAIWLALLLLVMPNKNIPILTNIGINTMPIFLMHGFIIKMIGKYKLVIQYRDFEYMVLLLLLGGIVLLLSSKPICKLFLYSLSIPDNIRKFIKKN